MKRSNRLILLIGVFLAIVAFVGIVIIFQGNRPSATPQQATELPTVFAAKPIPLGSEVTADMLAVQTKKTAERAATAFADKSLVIGKIARTDIAQGKQLEASDFQTPGGGTTLRPGDIKVPADQRAMAVQVDQVSGVGTVIRSGDYVDLLVGFQGDKFPVITIDPQNDSFTVVSGINATSVKLLLQGLQVLGTQLPPPETKTPQQSAAPDQGASLTGQQEIVVLSVTAQQSEVIKFAQLDGSISLILRSPKDFRDPVTNEPIVPSPNDTTGVTLRVLIDEYKLLIPQIVETILPAQENP